MVSPQRPFRIGQVVLLVLTTLLVVSHAAAEALVIVEVRAEGEAPEGTVILRSQAPGTATFQCSVSGGQCRIDQVPGGRYLVSFADRDGARTEPRPAMIPPSGTVTLVIPASSE